MSAAKHTPGPWRYVTDCGTHVIRESRTDGEFETYIASTWGGENEADARLIAASPALLAELKTVTFLLTSACLVIEDAESRAHAMAAVKSARAAIAAATGEKP